MDPLELSLNQKFELEHYRRVIRNTEDLAALKSLAEKLLEAWHTQKAATRWMMHENLSKPTYVSSLSSQTTDPLPTPT